MVRGFDSSCPHSELIELTEICFSGTESSKFSQLSVSKLKVKVLLPLWTAVASSPPPHRYMPVIGRASHCIAYWIQRQSHVKQILFQILRKRKKKANLKSEFRNDASEGSHPVASLLFVVPGGKQMSARNASSRFLQSPPPTTPTPHPPPPTLKVPVEREHPACDVCAFFFSSCQKSHETPGPRLLLPRRNLRFLLKQRKVSLFRCCRILLVIFSHCDRRRECTSSQ